MSAGGTALCCSLNPLAGCALHVAGEIWYHKYEHLNDMDDNFNKYSNEHMDEHLDDHKTKTKVCLTIFWQFPTKTKVYL